MSFMHILNEQSRETLSRKLGKTYDEILQMSAEELDALVEARIDKKPSLFKHCKEARLELTLQRYK